MVPIDVHHIRIEVNNSCNSNCCHKKETDLPVVDGTEKDQPPKKETSKTCNIV